LKLIGSGGRQTDQRPLHERLYGLLETLRAENEEVLLGEGPQKLIHDAYRTLAASAVQFEQVRKALKVFETLGLWRWVRGHERSAFGSIGPILPQIAAGDLEIIIELLTGTNHAPRPHSPQAAADEAKPRSEAHTSGGTSSYAEKPQKRERGPDIDKSRERVELLNKLIGELTTVLQQREKFVSAEALKEKYPEFELWKALHKAEWNELLTQEFKPKRFATSLVMRRYGLTSEDTLKKDRRKLKGFGTPKK